MSLLLRWILAVALTLPFSAVLALPQGEGVGMAVAVERPWRVTYPLVEGGKNVVILGPATRTMKATITPGPGITVRFEGGEAPNRSWFLKSERDGTLKLTVRSHRSQAWGPRVATLELVAEGAATRTIEVRLQGMRLLDAPPRPRGALELAIDWIRRHQLADGRLASRDTHMVFACKGKGAPCGNGGEEMHEVGLHALGLIAALRAGHADGWIKRGLDWLLTKQDAEGCFGSRKHYGFIYDSSLATEAMATGYHLLGYPEWRKAAQRGVRFIESAQNRDEVVRSAWRYGIRPGENDSSVTTWALRALYAGRMAGLTTSAEAIAGANRWLWTVTASFGHVGYDKLKENSVRFEGLLAIFPVRFTESLTAAGLSVMLQGGAPRPGMVARWIKGRGMIDAVPPAWDLKSAPKEIKERMTEDDKADPTRCSPLDFYYWQHATAAFRAWDATQDKKPVTKSWQKLPKLLAKHQRQKGCPRGSFDPDDPWGNAGGRMYATATLALALANLEYKAPLVNEFLP